MDTPEWLKPGLLGAAAGAVALAIVGFSWGGWATSGTVKKLASEQARMEVVAALVPICMEQAKMDPQSGETLAKLEAAASYERREMVMNAGWATMPGSNDPDRSVAMACMEKLSEQF